MSTLDDNGCEVVWGHPGPTPPSPNTSEGGPWKTYTKKKKKREKSEEERTVKRREREEEIGGRRVGHNFLTCPPARRSHNPPSDLVWGEC